MKAEPYCLHLEDEFTDVDSLVATQLQLSARNRHIAAINRGEAVPPSVLRGKGKQARIYQGDGVGGASQTELLVQKRVDLEERRRRKRDELVCQSTCP